VGSAGCSLRLRQIDPTASTMSEPRTEETYSTRSSITRSKGAIWPSKKRSRRGCNSRIGLDHIAGDPAQQDGTEPNQNAEPIEHHHDQRRPGNDHRDADGKAEDQQRKLAVAAAATAMTLSRLMTMSAITTIRIACQRLVPP